MEIVISSLWVAGITAAMLGVLAGVKALCGKMMRESRTRENTKIGE